MVSRGFTLIELVIVIFIVALVAAAAIPAIGNRSGNRMDSDTRLAASIIRYLDERASVTLEDMIMTIDMGRRTVTFDGENGREERTLETLVGVRQASGEQEGGDVVRAVFPAGGMSQHLRLLFEEEGEQKSVLYNPFSGRVTVEDGHGKDIAEGTEE